MLRARCHRGIPGSMTNGQHAKTIWVISSEKWGSILLSKHHYAIELAKQGHRVWFIDPPEGTTLLHSRFATRPLPDVPGLQVVSHSLFFPEAFKFHAWDIYVFLMRRQVRNLVRYIGEKPDLILSFDLQGHFPLRYFPRDVTRVYFPVDEPFIPRSLDAAKTADALISITREILDKFKGFDIPKLLLNHGLAEEFMDLPLRVHEPGRPLHVGLSGNFLRPDLDRATILQVVRENPSVTFECWGSIDPTRSNIGGQDGADTRAFVEALRAEPNVVLHGMVPKKVMAQGFTEMDAFLICYDIEKDQSKGTNYHKIMEFLSTGKVIISNNVTAYAKSGRMLAMTSDRTGNHELPGLFRSVIHDLSTWNAPELVEARRTFARDNSYTEQVRRVGAFLDDIAKTR